MTPLSLLFLSYLSEIRLLVDIFKSKNLHDVAIFNCWPEEVTIAVQKIFVINNIRTNNIMLNNISIPIHRSRVGIVVNNSCEDWQDLFDCGDSGIDFQNPYIWVFVTEELNTTTKEISQYPIEIDSDTTVAHKTQNGYDLYEMYHTGSKKSGVFKTVYIGNWTSALNIETPKRRNDLSGVVLSCAVVVLKKLEEETFEHYLVQSNHVGFDSLHKLKYITLLRYLKDMYNMTYDFIRTNSWGYIKNGSFDGMVGSLQREETDIGGSPVFFRADRNEVIDYTAEVWHSRHSFIFRHPKHPSGLYTIYTRPLSTMVWCSVLALLLFSAVVLCVMSKLRRPRLSDQSLSLALLFLLGALCQQGTSLMQQSTPMKILIFSTFVYSAILYQYYTASVVSTLLMEPPKNIKTLKDLLESNLRIGVEEALYDRDYFKRTTDPVALKIYKTKVRQGTSENFFTPEKGMALVKKGGFAFHVDTIVSYGIVKKTFSEREVCEIKDVPMYAPHRLGAVMKKHSPYRDHLAYGIRKVMETGLMYRVKWASDEPRPSCVKTPDSSIYSVTILEFSTPLIILSFGYCISFMVLVFEVISCYADNYWTD